MNQLSIKDFPLEGGSSLESITIAFQTFGTLTPEKDNVVWVCHALTANTNVLDWWNGLFGPGHLFDPKDYFIVCVNTLGSCYGSTGPLSPLDNQGPLLDLFPEITARDVARSFDLVRRHLELDSIKVIIGASLGGQHAMEWNILQPEIFESLVLVATNAKHSPFGIAFNESQRLAIEADQTYGNNNVDGGQKGLVAARSIALLSYRSYEIYGQTQSGEADSESAFPAARYQKYQGEKLVKRFNAYSYVCLSKMMDSHNVGRNRESIQAALKTISARTLVIGVTSDQLFPIEEQQFLAKNIRKAEFTAIESAYGHDGFLVETAKLTLLLEDFLFNNFRRNKPTVFRDLIPKNKLMNLLENPLNI